jgi:hypothetical protein
MITEKPLTAELISDMWSVNITKMHFQHNVCFQMRNWAFVITGVVIPLIWVGNPSTSTKFWLHIFTILLMGLILQKDLCWNGYHDMYRERARLCEKVVLGEAEVNSLLKDYSKLKPTPNVHQLRSALSPNSLFLLRTDFVELYLLLFWALSLLVTMIV